MDSTPTTPLEATAPSPENPTTPTKQVKKMGLSAYIASLRAKAETRVESGTHKGRGGFGSGRKHNHTKGWKRRDS